MRGRQLGAHAALLGDVGDDAADLHRPVAPAPRRGAIVDPARHAVGADQAVLDVALAPGAELAVEGLVGRTIVGVDRGVPVDHLGIRLGAAEQAVRPRPLEHLLDAPVGVDDGKVDVLADDVEQAGEPVGGFRRARVGLGASADVRDEPLHEHASVGATDGAGAVADQPGDAVEPGDAVAGLAIDRPRAAGD